MTVDANKRAKLSEVGYVVRRCCGNCEYSWLPSHVWGWCRENTYVHLKHNQADRMMSIHACGYCPKHKLSLHDVDMLQGFAEFVEEDEND